ncbi:MAG TPA: RIO1 family regulatory kinase/ATPase [Thermoplasmata archaeon]|nr:RIO1 family regulatory kinase/ATPase [Thermoplasmata archaeon]
MPNAPYLDKSVRWRIATGQVRESESRSSEVADAILDSGVATEVVRVIGAGKEADVYLCRENGDPIAVKVYRFFRTSHRGGRPVKAESMGQIASREFEMGFLAWRSGVPVPAPLRRVEHLLSMEFIGSGDEPAPRLKDTRPEDPDALLAAIADGVESLASAGVVHTDLSPFNILVHEGRPVFIDFASALRVDRLGYSPWMRLAEAKRALETGLLSLNRYFRRYGASLDAETLVARLVDRLDRFGVAR